jgi:hypothetical protein
VRAGIFRRRAASLKTLRRWVTMKHIRGISSGKVATADALADLYNAIWQIWLDYIYTKKNAIVTPSS